MSKVAHLDDHRPMEAIYELTVYRAADGSLSATPVWASDEWLDNNGTTPSERVNVMSYRLKTAFRNTGSRVLEC